MKKKEEKIIEDLRRKLAAARAVDDFKKISDLSLDIAQNLRNYGEREKAVEAFQEVLDVSGEARVKMDKILALRGIAELYSEHGDEECQVYLDQFERLVEGDPTEYQLMTTVGAYCMIKMYCFEDKNEYLIRARNYAEKSLRILNADAVNSKKMLEGDSVVIRKCNCYRMLSEIAGYQGEQEEAEEHSKAAYKFANSKEVRFEIARARIDFSWSDKVEASLDLCKLADSISKQKKVEANCFLAQSYFEREDMQKGIDALFVANDALGTKGSAANEDDREKYSELLIFGYKVSERVKRLQKCASENNKEGMYYQLDALGDLYSSAGYKKAALRYYQESLVLAKKKYRINALISCGETAAELKMFVKAAEYFDQVRLEETSLGKDTSETQASLFEMRLLGNFFKSNSNVIMEIDKLENDGNTFLNAVYSAAARYYAGKGMKEDADRFRTLEKHFLDENKRDEMSNGEDDEDSNKILDDIDELDDNYILEAMREQAAKFAKKKLLAKQFRKSNQYGESKLIERSREGTMEEVKALIDMGANVNEADPVGWTPLSEAVAANNFDIVKYLISKGAYPNSQSKEGWMETHFGGKITPLMEACTNGFHEIARWLLNHKSANTLVVTTNLDGWSAADFLADYLMRAKRGEESEAEYREKLEKCKEVFELIKRMQRTQGFPVRTGDPPLPRPKSDDTPRYAAEKEANRRAERSQRKRGAADEYEDVMVSVGSRGKQTDKDNKNKNKTKEKEKEDLFSPSDDEPLVTPSSANKKKKAIVLSSDSEDEKEESRETKENRRRKSIDIDDPNFGLENEEERPYSIKLSNGVTPLKKLSGVEMMMQKKKGKNRSTERGDENGIMIVSDDIEIVKERSDHKRRRQDSESSQSEAGSAVHLERRRSIGSLREQMDNGSDSPIGPIRSTESRSSLSSASALDFIGVKVVVVRSGNEPEPPFLSKAPSDTDIADLPKHIDRLRSTLDGETCEWIFQGVAVAAEDKMTLGDLAAMYNLRVVDVECRVKKSLKGDFEGRCDASDRGSPLSSALSTFEKSHRAPSLIIGDGSKYSEKTLETLWQVIEEYAEKKRKEDCSWRAECVQIDHFNVPVFALRTLIKLRPRETLSLRFCGLNDEKLEDMIEEMGAADLSRLNTLDLSYNLEISSSEMLARFINNVTGTGLKTIILQGLSGIEDGIALMKTLREMPKLSTLVLDENPWLDDECMTEMVRGDDAMGRLNQLKISRVAIRSMTWMDRSDAFKSLKSFNLCENNGITPSGWERLASFIRSNAALKTIDVKGTAVRPVLLEALAGRSSDASILTVILNRCSGVTASEMVRLLGPLVHDAGRVPNLKVHIESEKVEVVRSTAPDLASKVLKAVS